MLVNYPTTEPFPYISSRDSQAQLRSKKSQSRATPCEFISDLIASYSGMSRDPIKPNHMSSRDIIQRLLALVDQCKEIVMYLKLSFVSNKIQSEVTTLYPSSPHALDKTWTLLWCSICTQKSGTKKLLYSTEDRIIISVIELLCSNQDSQQDRKLHLWCHWIYKSCYTGHSGSCSARPSCCRGLETNFILRFKRMPLHGIENLFIVKSKAEVSFHIAYGAPPRYS